MAPYSRWRLCLLVVASLVCCVSTQRTCQRAGKDVATKWRTNSSSWSVSWRLDFVCSSYEACYGFPDSGKDVWVQLCPIEIQYGDKVFIEPPVFGPPRPHPVNVSRDSWINCPSSDYPKTQYLFPNPLTMRSEVPSKFLQPGVQYFAQAPDGAFSNCLFGLRLNLTVKTHDCAKSGVGELCSGSGNCSSKLFQEDYRCACDESRRGRYCEEKNPCHPNPCLYGGTCDPSDTAAASTGGLNYTCSCRAGLTGKPMNNAFKTARPQEKVVCFL